jgi:hypothetical protein
LDEFLYLLLHVNIVIFANTTEIVQKNIITSLTLSFPLTIVYLRFITEIKTATKHIIIETIEITNDILALFALSFILSPQANVIEASIVTILQKV